MAGLTCPRCGALAFRYLYGCEYEGPCYFHNLGRFDAEAYSYRLDDVKNSPDFLARLNADWDKVFGTDK
jgi:hypothetical protein